MITMKFMSLVAATAVNTAINTDNVAVVAINYVLIGTPW